MELKKFSKRTGNWKLVSLTTWDWRRVCLEAYTDMVSRTPPPFNRKVFCPSFRARTPLPRPNQVLVKQEHSLLVYSRALRQIPKQVSLNIAKHLLFHQLVNFQCKLHMLYTQLVSIWESKFKLASVALLSRKTLSNLRVVAPTSLSVHPAVFTIWWSVVSSRQSTWKFSFLTKLTRCFHVDSKLKFKTFLSFCQETFKSLYSQLHYHQRSWAWLSTSCVNPQRS